MFKYAIDGIINFSQAPLSVASWFGITMTGFSFVALIGIILRKLIFANIFSSHLPTDFHHTKVSKKCLFGKNFDYLCTNKKKE